MAAASSNVTTTMRIDTEELQRAVGTMSSEISAGLKQNVADVERTLMTVSAESQRPDEAGRRAGRARADRPCRPRSSGNLRQDAAEWSAR